MKLSQHDSALGDERLPRRLGLISVTSVLVGIIIGSGIFRVPAQVAAQVGSVGGAALLWVLGAAIALAGGLTLAELTTAYPTAGGAYVFIRQAWGPLVAFLFGWVKLVVTGPAALAAVCLIFASYAGAFIPLTDAQQRIVGSALLLVLTLTNMFSVRWSAAVQNVSTAAKVLTLTVLSVLLLVFGTPAQGALHGQVSLSPLSWGGFGVALIGVLWTYVGWVDVTYVAGETSDPSFTFPRAMFWGLAAVLVVYLLANAAFYYVLPMNDLAGSPMVAASAAERVFGSAGRFFVAALVMLSTFGSLNGSLLSTPRVFYAMARDGLFFRAIGEVHPRYQTPHLSILLYLGLGILGIATKTFEQLAEIFVLGTWPFYALAVGAIFRLRPRYLGEAGDRVYRVFGYPWVPAGFLVISVALIVNGAIQRPAQFGLSLGILVLGIPAYQVWRVVQARRALTRPVST